MCGRAPRVREVQGQAGIQGVPQLQQISRGKEHRSWWEKKQAIHIENLMQNANTYYLFRKDGKITLRGQMNFFMVVNVLLLLNVSGTKIEFIQIRFLWKGTLILSFVKSTIGENIVKKVY